MDSWEAQQGLGRAVTAEGKWGEMNRGAETEVEETLFPQLPLGACYLIE